jgi:VWFA-related protein
LVNKNMKSFQKTSFLAVTCSLALFGQLPSPDQLKPQPGEIAKPLPGQTAPKSTEPQDSGVAKITVTTRTVLAPTTVMEKKTGSFINGLALSNFTLLDNDKPQKIDADFSYAPISVALVIQANSDVEPVLPKLKKAGLLLHGLITGDTGEVAVIAFDHRIQVLQDFTKDPDKIDDSLERLKAGSSGAALIDSIAEATRMLSHRPAGNRRIILLVAQDRDKGSKAKQAETVRGLEFNSVQIYAVDVGKYFPALMRTPQDPRPAYGGIPPAAIGSTRGDTATDTTAMQNYQLGNWLNIAPPIYRSITEIFKLTPEQAFTRYTGGTTYTFAAKTSSLERAIDDIGKEIHSQYVLSYTPNNENEPGFHTIKVMVDKVGLEVRTRPGYYWGGGQF